MTREPRRFCKEDMEIHKRFNFLIKRMFLVLPLDLCYAESLGHVRLFCNPCLLNSPGQSPGVGFHFLLQGIFPSRKSNLHLFFLMHFARGFFTAWSPGKSLRLTVFPFIQTISVRSDIPSSSNVLANVWLCFSRSLISDCFISYL